MEKHTQGRLTASFGGLITEPPRQNVAKCVNPIDATRLAACWNACEGIETTDLTSRVVLMDSYDELRAVNTDLLAALEAVDEFWAGGDAPQELTAKMRAAIAKARGL